MLKVSLDRQLLDQLMEIPEVAAAGFSARTGLTGSGVTVLNGRTYFGSWRVAGDSLAWISSSAYDDDQFVHTVDEALRHTLLLILKYLQAVHFVCAPQAVAS